MRAALIDVGGTLWSEGTGGVQPRGHHSGSNPVERHGVEWEARLSQADVPTDRVSVLRENLSPLVQMAVENAEYFDIWAAIREASAIAGLANIDAERIRAASCLPASSFTAPFVGALDLLTALHHHDIRVVLICNAIWRTSDDYWSDFRSFRLSDQIDAILSSVDLRSRKPSRAFFEAALQEAAAPPMDCVVIANSEVSDIEPAKALGMRAIRVAIDEPPPPATNADYVCTSLTEVETVLHKAC